VTFSEQLAQRIEIAAGSAAYSNYQRARAALLGMLDEASAAPSSYWGEELAGMEYMLDASPLVIARLRHHCYHVTGVWPYNYREQRPAKRDRQYDDHRRKLDALLEIGRRDLFVPESPALGGFGFAFDEGLVNIDTLKFFEAMIALDRGEVLGEFRESGERKVVWEIGAGWGGFAYQFKTLFPDATYVITDLPQLFLYSATYLATVFPDARIGFHSRAGDDVDWLEHDFVFVPYPSLDAVAPPRLDLVVNMVSFQEMTTEQVQRYVERAHEAGASFLYSLNRERSRFNTELTGVSPILEQRFWPHEISLLPVGHQESLDGGSKRDENRYKHLVCLPRVLA
jgi:hypothetical protein